MIYHQQGLFYLLCISHALKADAVARADGHCDLPCESDCPERDRPQANPGGMFSKIAPPHTPSNPGWAFC